MLPLLWKLFVIPLLWPLCVAITVNTVCNTITTNTICVALTIIFVYQHSYNSTKTNQKGITIMSNKTSSNVSYWQCTRRQTAWQCQQWRWWTWFMGWHSSSAFFVVGMLWSVVATALGSTRNITIAVQWHVSVNTHHIVKESAHWHANCTDKGAFIKYIMGQQVCEINMFWTPTATTQHFSLILFPNKLCTWICMHVIMCISLS